MITPSPRSERRRLDADAWRRIGAVLDRLCDVDLRARPEALDEACRAEGVASDDVRPYLDAEHRSEFPGPLDPALVEGALRPITAEAAAVRLAPGTRLGPYEILSLVGAGGMGEVYRARDTRLNRIVAVKRLTAHMAMSAEGRKRFEREAQVTSTLNHPHICTLHDVGEHDGVGFLVMEFTEGETLAARLARGSLPVHEVLQHAAQMADALAFAHGHGIVHRDLKPANVMLTAHGVKLLDFGLAALRPPIGSLEGADEQEATPTGLILGTLKYTAPEQLQGKPVDGRADLFAFGAILYEMLTGRQAFAADCPADVVAAVLTRVPAPTAAERQDVPPALDWVVGQCLIKAAEERWQSAADLARHLRWVQASRTTAEASVAPGSDRPARPGAFLWVVATAAAVLSGIAIAPLLLTRSPSGTPFPFRFEIAAPAGLSCTGLLALSPDGRRLAFTATDAAGARALWVRPLEETTARRIEGTEGALHPFWSPNAGSIGFFADRKLKVVDLVTGTVRMLTDAGPGGGGTWNADDVILFADDATASGSSSGGLKRVPAAGGVAQHVTPFDRTDRAVQAFPHFLPDGRHYLYMQLGVSEPGVYAGRLDDGDRRRILPALVTPGLSDQVNVHGPVRATYAAGHVFYVDNSHRTLMAQPFDAGRLQLTGAAVKIAGDVETAAPGLSAYDASANGVLVYRAPPASPASMTVLSNWFSLAQHQP